MTLYKKLARKEYFKYTVQGLYVCCVKDKEIGINNKRNGLLWIKRISNIWSWILTAH